MSTGIESNLEWLSPVYGRIQTVYLGQLTYKNCFSEVIDEGSGKYHCGIWGLNTWAGIHDLFPIAGPKFREIMRNTLDKGLEFTEEGTGLLPHSIPIGRGEEIGCRDGKKFIEYRCYGGVHGEGYNLDNMNCWAQMILLYYLYSRDDVWFTDEKLAKVERSVNYMLERLTGEYNPVLLEAGIEGDWTENTNWHADNAVANVFFYRTLVLLARAELIKGRNGLARKYDEAAERIRQEFNKDIKDGGFWDGSRGCYVHGNDGTGGRVYGTDYFETTANVMAALWGIAGHFRTGTILGYIKRHAEMENPYPIMTNHPVRTHARRPQYRQTVTNGDVWFFLGGHSTALRLRNFQRREATRLYKVICDYERENGTIHNSIFGDGSVDGKWSPEIGNYGGLYTPFTEGVLGLEPMDNGLRIKPMPLDGLKRLSVPLFYAGKDFRLELEGDGLKVISSDIDGKPLGKSPSGELMIAPDAVKNGSVVTLRLSR